MTPPKRPDNLCTAVVPINPATPSKCDDGFGSIPSFTPSVKDAAIWEAREILLRYHVQERVDYPPTDPAKVIETLQSWLDEPDGEEPFDVDSIELVRI